VAAADINFIRGKKTGVSTFKVDGETYYGVAPAVPNTARYFATTVAILVPERDLTGDLNTARDVTIAICVATVVVAALIAMLGVTVMLRPLRVITERMGRTAKLQLQTYGAAESVESSLWEIKVLQRAYEDMHTAVDSFTRYVPRDVVKDLMQTGQLCAIGMNATQCTMLFADIAGFTSICERVPTARLGAMITAFFETASHLVMTHGGLVDKFIGDCVMAVWGAPFPCSSMQAKAALCALRMSHATVVEPLAGIFDREGELLALRIGVNTGEVLAGNMGSAQRMSYTVIGDAVNLAARLEGLNKKFGTRVMLSEFVVHPSDDSSLHFSGHAEDVNGQAFLRAAPTSAVMDLLVTRLLGRVRVVGKEEPVGVYEAVGLTGRDAKDEDGVERSEASVASGSGISPSLGHSHATPGEPPMGEVSLEPADVAKGQLPYQKQVPKPPRRAAALPLPKLVAQALALADAPLRCGDAVRSFCAAYDSACALYCEGRPEDCMAALRALAALHPAFVPEDALPVPQQPITSKGPSLHHLSDAIAGVDCVTATEEHEHRRNHASSMGAGERVGYGSTVLSASVPVTLRDLFELCQNNNGDGVMQASEK
jgi:class 3 adenylate cyclase